MNNFDIKDYKYESLSYLLENDLIGYALFKENNSNCIKCLLNKEPLKDYAKINGDGNYYISAIYYSNNGNYLGDEKYFFTVNVTI